MDEEAGPGLTRLERYLARMPGGLGAYPEAEVRGTHVRTLLEGQPRAPLLALGRDEARLALRFPPRLFDATFLQMYADSFAVALEGTRAHNPRVEVESADDARAHFLFRW